ncbi:hypothetical protein B0H13DRAFT_2301439 [Mycena leptocephala]|nr:hypothetical protein B0H13DRAFT_2301439 [Mycena leptocephala]
MLPILYHCAARRSRRHGIPYTRLGSSAIDVQGEVHLDGLSRVTLSFGTSSLLATTRTATRGFLSTSSVSECSIRKSALVSAYPLLAAAIPRLGSSTARRASRMHDETQTPDRHTTHER